MEPRAVSQLESIISASADEHKSFIEDDVLGDAETSCGDEYTTPQVLAVVPQVK